MKRRNFLQVLTVSLVAARSSMAAGLPIDYAAIRKLLKGRKLFFVPFSHTDWAWSNSRAWMVDRHAKVLEEALDLVKSIPGFRFYIETWNEQMETFLARRPDRIEEMKQAMNSGQIAVCGATTNQHPGWMEMESLLRDLIIGRQLFHAFAPEANLEVLAKPDVTPGSSQMPQILAKAGYRYFAVNRPDEGFTQSGIPRQFIWKGLDGTQVIVSRDGGCGFTAGDTLIDDFKNKWPAAVEQIYKSEIIKRLEKNTRRPIWLPVGCDDSRPLRHWQPEEIDGKFDEKLLPIPEFINEWNKREQSVLQFASPREVFREIEGGRADLPVCEGIIEPTMWTYWYGINGNEGLRLWRTKADSELVSGQLLWACAPSENEEQSTEKEYAALWRDLLRAYSHAQMWLFTEDYNAALNIVKTTLANAVAVKKHALDQIVGRMNIDEHRQSIVLFNELPWERTEVIEVWAQMQHPEATNVRVTDGRGANVPFQVIEVLFYHNGIKESGVKTIREMKLLIKPTVPPVGYTTIYFEPAEGRIQVPQSRSGPGTIDSDSATIRVSEQGVESILQKSSGITFKEAGNVIFHEIKEGGVYDYGEVINKFSLTNGKVEKIQEGPLRSSFRISGNLGKHRIVYEGHYYPHTFRLSFETTIINEGASGYFMTVADMPSAGKLHSDIHFGLEERDVSKIVYKGSERLRSNVFWGSHWTNWSDGKSGLTLVTTTGEKGFQYFPETRRLGHFLLKSIPPATETVRRFVTKAREGTGKHLFDYQFILHEGDVHEANVTRRALEARQPFVIVNPNWMAPKARRTLAVTDSFMNIRTENVQMSAMYEDGGKKILRIYESSGKAVRAVIDLPFAPNGAREVDFNGVPQERTILTKAQTIELDMKPWEIITIQIG